MLAKSALLCAVLLLLAAISSVNTACAEENGSNNHPYLAILLKHADELNMTSEQKTKMTELADTPKKYPVWQKLQMILTKDQLSRVEILVRHAQDEVRAAHPDDNDDHK